MAARVLVLLGLVTWAGCLEPSLTYCSDGRACSADLVCDEIHHSCVTPDQLTACRDLVNGAACMTEDITGLCFDEVCVVPGCGNHVVEPGELCDDGNRLSGDGCSVDCESTESCGNGVVDTARAEMCDDGNLASHDGCNSQCGLEAQTWRAHPVYLQTIDRHTVAFDSIRRRVVSLSGAIWEWDGAHWFVSAAPVPMVNWQAAAFDPIRQVVVFIATKPNANTLATYAWNGDNLVEVPTTGVDPGPSAAAMEWDGARQKLVVVTNNAGFYLDLGTGTWTAMPMSIGPVGQPSLAFDPDSGTLILYDQSLNNTYAWNGTSWTPYGSSPRGQSSTALAYDAKNHRMLAIGGGSAPTAIDILTTSGWTPAVIDSDTRNGAFAWYDPVAQTVRVMGGNTDAMLVIDGGQKTTVAVLHPTAMVHSLVYDAKRGRLAMFDSSGNGWVWSETWPALPSPGIVNFAGYPVYDPVREAMVAVTVEQTPQMMVLGDSWSSLGTFPQNAPLSDLSYDYKNRRIIAGTNDRVYALGSSATTWQPLPPQPWMPSPVSTGFDLGRDTVAVLTFGPDSLLYDLENGAWTQSLSPGFGYRIFTSLQSRSLLMIPVAITGTPRQLWERSGGVFKPLGYIPLTTNITDVAELPYGRIMMLANSGLGTYMLERQLTSSLPDETCAAGEDADGDGAAACADPDCWWSCWPACPVATSCP